MHAGQIEAVAPDRLQNGVEIMRQETDEVLLRVANQGKLLSRPELEDPLRFRFHHRLDPGNGHRLVDLGHNPNAAFSGSAEILGKLGISGPLARTASAST